MTDSFATLTNGQVIAGLFLSELVVALLVYSLCEWVRAGSRRRWTSRKRWAK